MPLQAAVTNLLSVAAAFGVLTAVFQWGWGLASLIGLDAPHDTVPIASYVPLMMFAVLFGLSMDYEVFLMSQHRAASRGRQRRTRRCHRAGRERAGDHGGGDHHDLRLRAASSSTATRWSSSSASGSRSAVLLAATMVLLLAPALLSLFGAATWWLPGWLDRWLPHISIEGEAATDEEPEGLDEGEVVASQ